MMDIDQDRDRIAKRMREIKAPSKMAKLTEFPSLQKEIQLHCDRPDQDYLAKPVVLYNPIFDQFLAECVDASVTDRFYGDVATMCLSMSDFFPDEHQRRRVFVRHFEGLLGMKCQPMMHSENNSSNDGAIVYDFLSFSSPTRAVLLFCEAKNEAGVGGCDPLLQGMLTYGRWCATQREHNLWPCTCFPAFIVTLIGPSLSIYGAIYLDRVHVNRLAEAILTLSLDNRKVIRVAHIIKALTVACNNLQDYWSKLSKLDDTNTEMKDKQSLFPFPRSGEEFEFIYTGQIRKLTSLIYTARLTTTEEEIVIKFVKQYNAEAHRLCATNNSAPVLLCYKPRVVQEWGMVVMKYLGTTETLYDIIQNFSLKLSAEEKINIYRDVTKAVRLLHSCDYVFGDLRTTNIIITYSPTCGRYQAQLIDFDWVGRANVDKYPTLNPDIDWPSGVGGGMTMKREHDLIWLERLSKELGLSVESLPEVEML